MKISQPQVILCNQSCLSEPGEKHIETYHLKGSFLEQIFEIGLFDLDHTKHKAETVGSFCLLFSSLIKNCRDGCIGLFFSSKILSFRVGSWKPCENQGFQFANWVKIGVPFLGMLPLPVTLTTRIIT